MNSGVMRGEFAGWMIYRGSVFLGGVRRVSSLRSIIYYFHALFFCGSPGARSVLTAWWR